MGSHWVSILLNKEWTLNGIPLSVHFIVQRIEELYKELNWIEVKWSKVKWSVVQVRGVNRSVPWRVYTVCEVKWSEVKWSEVKWSEVKWSEVKWSEDPVKIGVL